VTDHHVRQLAESEFRDAHDVFMGALHRPPLTDEQWRDRSTQLEPGRVLGAFRDGELVGAALSVPSSLAVPGGKAIPAGAVSGVGVRADRTRRGALTVLMREQFNNVRERGETVAMLHASEATIYGRFGYGPATRARRVSIDTYRAVPRPGAPGGGHVRLVDRGEGLRILPGLYRSIQSRRPGTISRTDNWWRAKLARMEHGVLVVHTGADGVDDGFALYEPKASDHRFDDGSCTLQVEDIQAVDTVATAAVWQFLLGVDLVDTVQAIHRPVDEPLEWWLTDRRTCRVTTVDDDLWVRLVDVSSALSARTFGGSEPVVIEVRDAVIPDNAGNYRIGPDGVQHCERPAQLSLNADVLGALYLGDVTISTLAAANRIDVRDPAAVAVADQVFATPEIPWCGTSF
jgi:predicted acetyltransferase